MSNAGKKDLSLAQSIGELNKKAELTDKISKSANPKQWLVSANKVFKKAEHSDVMKDEENAYVLFMRFLHIMEEVKKTTKYQQEKKYYGSLVSLKSQMRAIDRAEILSASLEERYKKCQLETAMALEKEKKAKEEEAKAEKQAKTLNGTSISMTEIDDLLSGKKPATQTSSDVYKKLQVDHGAILSPLDNSGRKTDPLSSNASPLKSVPSLVIDPVTLYQLLNDKNKKDSILILDTRSKKDFELSRINYNCCINIPDDLLKTSVHVGSIERKLPRNTWDQWITRGEKEHIVIFDQDTNYADVTPDSKVKCLKDAIHLYDTSCSLRSEPLILDGGFEAWLWHYPSLVTNSVLPKKTPKRDIEPDVNIEALSYPELPVNHEKTRPPLAINGENGPSLGDDTDLQHVPRRPDTNETSSRSTRSPVQYNQPTSLNGSVSQPSRDNVRLTSPISTTVARPTASESVNPSINHSKPPATVQYVPQDLTSPKIIPNLSIPATSSNQYSTPLNYPPSVTNKPGATPTLPPSSLGYPSTPLNVPASHSNPSVYQTSHVVRNTQPSIPLAPGTRPTLPSPGPKPSTFQPKTGQADADVTGVKASNNEISSSPQENSTKVPYGKPPSTARDVSLPSNNITLPSSQVTPQAESSTTTTTPNHQLRSSVIRPPNALPVSSSPKMRQSNTVISTTTAVNPPSISSTPPQLTNTNAKTPPERPTINPQAPPGSISSVPPQKDEPTSDQQTSSVSSPQPFIPNVPQKFTSSRTGMTHGLPPGWERVLDHRTGRYYFRDHNTKTTHWYPPSSLAKSINESLMGQNVTAKDNEAKTTSMKRSLSSPNLAKLDSLEKSQAITDDRSSRPVVNRRTKPLSENQLSNLAPVHGGQGKALTGLRNLGNSCYMNSILQCLISTTPLVKYILNSYYVDDINKTNPLGTGGRIAEELAVLTRVAHSGNYRYVSPIDFKRTIGRFATHFGGHQQQDSQEFLLFLLDQFHEDTNKVIRKAYIEEKSNDGLPDRVAAKLAWDNHKTRNKSIIVELLQGLFKSTLTCDVCNKQSVTFEPFMSLTLPIPTNGSYQIEDCIRLFTTKEKVSKDNRWFCPRCKQHREAWKKMEIWKLPPILIVHFNRFKRDYDGSWLEKRQNYVTFPLGNFDMSKFVIGPKKSLHYNLYGVSNHYGSMQSGHYTAFCRNTYDKKWYKFDDEIVSSMSESSTKSSAAYILFYTSIEFSSP